MGRPTRGVSSLLITYSIAVAILLLLIHPASPALQEAAGVRTVDAAFYGKYSVRGFDANLSAGETSKNVSWSARIDPDARILDASLRVTGSPVFVSKTITGWGTAQRSNELFGLAIDGRADYNDDGLPDFAVSAPAYQSGALQGGRVDVYYGSSAGVMAINDPSWSYTGPGGRGFGYSLTHGDYNDDGIDDLVAGEYQRFNGSSAMDETVYLFYGSLAGLPSSPSVTLVSANNTSLNRFGFALAGGVDVDGDGYDELVVSEPYYYILEPPGCDDLNFSCYYYQVGRTHVFWGDPSGLDVARRTTLEYNTTYHYGLVLRALGDTDGDGLGEFAVGSPENGSNVGAVDIYEGIAGTTNLSLVWSSMGTGFSYFGISISGGADLTGDGIADLLVGAPFLGNTGMAYIFDGTGGASYASNPWASIRGPGPNFGYFGWALDIVGDVDGDALQDVVVGAFYDHNSTGAAYLYTLGAFAAGAEHPIASPYPDYSSSYFGYTVARIGDFNLDGFDDYAVGAVYGSNGTRNPGSVTLYPRTLHPWPENVTLYVGDQPAWSLAGPLNASAKVTGLGGVLDAYLAAHRREVDLSGHVRIPLWFNFSEGGRFNASDLLITYTVIQTPVDLTVTEASNHYALIVGWRTPASPDITLFTLWTNKTGSWQRIDNFTAPSLEYYDFDLALGQTACYRVTAWDPDAGIESAPTPEACGAIQDRTPPSIPANVTAQGNALARTTLLGWGPGESDLDHYEVWRRDGDTGTFRWLTNVSAPAVSYLDSGLAESTNYSYKVRAVNQRGLMSSFSLPAEAAIPDQTAPEAPSGLTGRSLSTGDAIGLNWTSAPSDVVGFRVYMSSVSRTGPFSLVGSTAALNLVARGLKSNVTYHFYAVAVDEADNPSEGSAIISVLTVDSVAPHSPMGLEVSTHFAGHTLVLTWDPSPEADIWGYYVYFLDPTIASEFTFLAAVTAPETSFSHIGLRNGIVYAYYLTAVDTSGNESPKSNEEVGVPRREIPPEPPLLSPPEPLSNTSQVDLFGSADKDLRVELWVNGEKQVTLEVDESGRFHGIVALDGGDNTVYARVIDPSAVTSPENRVSAPSATYHIWLDAELPRVMRSSPFPGQIDADPDGGVTIWVSERLDPATVHLVVKDTNGSRVEGTVAYDDGLQRTVFTPAQPLGFARTFTVQFSGADLAGNELTLHAYTFFTRPEPEPLPTTPPSTPGFEGVAALAAAIVAAAAALGARRRISPRNHKHPEEFP